MTSSPPAAGGPVVFTGATVYETPARRRHGDLVVDGPTIGAGLGGAETVDVSGASLVPLRNDPLSAASGVAGDADPSDLVPGNRASFAITRGRVSAAQLHGTLLIDPRDLVAVVLAGKVMAWEGAAVPDAAAERGAPAWVGAWRDDTHDMTQHLRPDGRYSETRNGRVDAWTGRYWTHGAQIVYLDDTGFWAFGEQHRNVLYHAHFVLTR